MNSRKAIRELDRFEFSWPPDLPIFLEPKDVNEIVHGFQEEMNSLLTKLDETRSKYGREFGGLTEDKLPPTKELVASASETLDKAAVIWLRRNNFFLDWDRYTTVSRRFSMAVKDAQLVAERQQYVTAIKRAFETDSYVMPTYHCTAHGYFAALNEAEGAKSANLVEIAKRTDLDTRYAMEYIGRLTEEVKYIRTELDMIRSSLMETTKF